MNIIQMAEYEDFLTMICNILEDKRQPESHSEQEYFSSYGYRSRLYKLLNKSSKEEHEVVLKAFYIGMWLEREAEVVRGEYLKQLNGKSWKWIDVEKLCVFLFTNRNSSRYLRMTLDNYLNINEEGQRLII